MLYKDEVWDEKRFEKLILWRRRYIRFRDRLVLVRVEEEVKLSKFKKWS